MINSNHIRLLRLPFSFLLLPVFLFALSETTTASFADVAILFVVLHLFIYPASNAYNSYIDQDDGPIGGLENPPKADKTVFYLSVLFDATGCLLAGFISLECAAYVVIYIIASRAYSSRLIRLKKYPIAGYLTVVLFQGAFTYYATFKVLEGLSPEINPVFIAALLIGGVYPLTQIYQHEADKKDGVKTISILLGYKGTFMLTALVFSIAMALFYIHFQQRPEHFWILQGFMLPVLAYFFYWFAKVWKNSSEANFKHTMRMNIIASAMLNIYFTYGIILRYMA